MINVEISAGLQAGELLGSSQLQLGVAKSVLSQPEMLDVYVDLISADGEKTSTRSMVDTQVGRLSVSRIMRFRDEHSRPSVLSREEALAHLTDAMWQEEAMKRYHQRRTLGRCLQVTKYALRAPTEFVPQAVRKVSLPNVIVTDMYPDNILDVFVSQDVEDRLLRN